MSKSIGMVNITKMKMKMGKTKNTWKKKDRTTSMKKNKSLRKKNMLVNPTSKNKK